MMQLQPLPNRVLVRPDLKRTTTASGLSLVLDWNPEMTGVVAFVGAGARCVECGAGSEAPVAVGDHVVFGATAGSKVILDGAEYLVLTFDDLLATLEEMSCP